MVLFLVIATREMQIFLTLNLFVFRSTLPYPGTQEQYEVRTLRDTLLKRICLARFVSVILSTALCKRQSGTQEFI